MGKKKKDLPPHPVRIVVNKKGHALPPDRAAKMDVVPDIVFVRKDGWALGAPFSLADVAYDLWKDEWDIFYNVLSGRDITFRANLYETWRTNKKKGGRSNGQTN